MKKPVPEPVEQAVEETIDEVIARHDMMDLFENLSFAEKVRKVLDGLRMPKDTGEYKWARLQVFRLWSPAAAVFLPLFLLLVIGVLANVADTGAPAFEVKMVEPEKPPDVEPPKPEPPETLQQPEIVNMDIQPVVTDNPLPGPANEFSPQPAPFDSVAIVRSPIIMKGIYGSRSPGSRGTALRTYGGGNWTEDAVLRALRWLKKNQADDGGWDEKASKTAMSGFALLTFLAHGETPASEEFGETVEKAIRFLIGAQKMNGRFNYNDGHEYCHPIAAYALSEAYGITKNPMIRDAAYKAIEIIIKGQHASGGWNYNCDGADRDDTSYMAWCAQALKAAKMANLENDGLDTAMKKAISGFKKNAAPSGGFGYTSPGTGGLTGAGVLCMQLLGAANDPDCKNGLVWLDQVTHDWKNPWGARPLYYYYYITQAKFHAGGEVWKKWNNMFAMDTVKNQTIVKAAYTAPDGSVKDIGYWEAPGGKEAHGLVYNTTLCALQLQVYYRYLPTYKPVEIVEEEKRAALEEEIPIQVKAN